MDKAQAIANAEAMGMELNEYLDLYQITLEEGKTEDPQETTPPVDQNQTPAGDSSSGDISLESPGVDPYLLSEEELEGSEEDVYAKINAKLGAVGIKTDQFLPGFNAIKLTTADGNRTSVSWATAKTAKERAAILNEFVAANADTSYVDKVGVGKEDIINDYYKATDIKEPSIEEAKDNFVNTRIANWNRREKRDTGMGTSMRVDLLEDDFDDPTEYELYKSWKETGVVKVDEDAISSHQKDMAFEAKNRQSEKFIDNLSDEDREAVSAVLSNDMVQKQYRLKNIDQEVSEANNLWVETKSMIDAWNEKGGGDAEERAEIQRRIATAASLSEDINSFVEDVADSQDLTMAVQNFNKNYSLLSKLGVGFEEVGLNIAYGASQLAAYAAGSNNGGGMVMGGVYADLVTDAFKPALEDVAKERQQFATGPSLSQMDGSFDDLVDWVGNTAVQAVPSLSLAFTGPAAMPLFFMSGYGGAASEFALNEYQALDRMAENSKLLESGVELSEEDIARINAEMEEDSKTVNIEDWRKVGYATLAGAAEVAFEAVGTLNILKGASKAVNPTTLRAAGTKFLKAANQEGMSEAATEITNNVGRNIFFGEDINIFEGATEGAVEAYAGGALVGGPLSLKGSAPIVYEYAVSTLMDSRTRKDIQKKLKQLEELTGFKNLDNVLKGAANRPGRFSPEVEKLVNEINEEIDLLKDGVANRLGADISNAQAYKIAAVTMEMRQINDRFRKMAESGVEGAELQAAEKTLRAKFDKLAAERESLLTDQSGTKEAKEYNDKLKVSMDAKAGYEVMLGRQYIRKRADYAQAFAAQNQSTINDYLAKAKEELGENATAEDIRFKANENYFVEKTKKEIAQNKESAANFARANGLDVTFIEADKNNIDQIAKEYGGSADADAFISADGKTIVVNTDVAAINGRAGVWSHEVLHALTKNKLGSDANANKAGKELLGWLEKNSPDVYAYVTARLGTNYEGDDAYFEEAMNTLSDYIAEGNEVNVSTLGQLRMFVSKIFGEGKGSIELDNGEQTFAFIATYANKNKNSKTVELIRAFGRAARKDDEKKGKSKASMSASAERAKQVLEKVSSNMDFFDPNSPLIARVLPGMIEAQLVPYINKGLKVDKEEAVSDVLMRLYTGGEIGKYNGKGTLYGYLNGRIKYRILDAFKNNSALVEDFAQSDIEDLKGAAADVTTIEQTEERTEAERPTYKTLTERKVVEPEVMETIKGKLPRIVGTLKSKINAPISKNKTVTPLVNELRLALGKQIDIDLKKAMGGKKDGQLRKWLQKNRKAILENMTTTYLMTAMPNAIQKKVDGVWTSDWAGKKIDRESVATDSAGRTSGAEMVRRLPQASLKISEADFLANILEPSGNPIRGRKESLAKAIAEELAIEMVNAEMQNPESKVYEAFTANQERLEVELTDSFATKLALDFERGNVKFSKTFNRAETEQKNVQAALRAGIKYIIKDGINVIDLEKDGIVSDHNFAKIKTFLLDRDPSIDNVDREKLYGALVELEKAGAISQFPGNVRGVLKASSNPALKDLHPSYTSLYVLQKTMTALADAASNKNLTAEERLEKSKKLEELRAELISYENSMISLVSKLSPKELSKYTVASIVNTLNPDSTAKVKAAADQSEAKDSVKNVELAQSYISGGGIAAKLFELQNGDVENKAEEIAKSGLLNVIQTTNIANKALSAHVATALIVEYKKGEISLKNLVRFLQTQGDYRQGGFAAHGQLTYFTLENFQSDAKQKIEHVYPNMNILMGIAEIAADENITLNSFNEAGADIANAVSTLLDANTLWADNNDRTDYLDTAGKTNTSGLGRFAAIAKGDRANIYSTTTKSVTFEDWVNGNLKLETLEDHIAKKEEVKKYDVKYSKVAKHAAMLKPSVKFSKSTPRAVFMVGAPGSGKSSVLKGLSLIDNGYRLINQDPYLEKLKKEANLPADEKQYTKEQLSMRSKLGWQARKAAEADLANYTASKESMVVDGTGASYNATTKKMKALEAAGFEIHMVYVKTTKETAKARNNARAARSLAPFIVSKTWASVQESAAKYKQDYGNRFYELQTDNLAYGEALPKEFVDQVNNGLEASSAKFSKSLNTQFNEMIERTKGISSTRVFSSVQAKMLGEKIGKYRLFLPASAEDFRGLTSYSFAGKGKQGEADQKFFEENIINPYVAGVARIEAVKQQIRREYHAVAKANKPAFKMLGKKISNTKFTYDQALRVYLWTQQGIEIPGMDKDDTAFLINEINQNPQLIELGNAMMAISRQDTWIEPNEHWMGHTLVSELNSMTEKVGRKKYLEQFIENVDVIFSNENLNKIEAIYGTRHKEAIKDAIYSMKNGRNRPSGADAQLNAWANWVNNSTGAIMFFNIRSAVLQTLSATNFINWSDNNPIKAAAAFANQKQYWSDFAMIFNSDKLKQRRSGLQTDVNAAEIANQADGAQNKAAAVVSYLLKIGFTPTQMADSFAIGIGGASFYRNRANTYIKEGFTKEEAEAKAFEDFSKTADEAQQSSDPYLVSQEQRSPLGRLVLAFQNTPMQYTRLMKKASQDLIAGRGDAKTHISKIIYYGAVQNFVFSALQSALFAMLPGFDDDDEELDEKELEKKERKEDEKILRIINSMTDSVLKGSGVKGAVLATVKNTITEYFKQEEKGFTADHTYTILQAVSLSPPIGSKARKIYASIQGMKFNKDVLEAEGFNVMADGRVNLSPAYSIIGSLVSGVGNVPMDRMVDIITSYSEALDERNKTWQRIALALGWKTWDVGAKNEEHDLIKTEAKARRKKEGKIKAKETRAKNKKKKQDTWQAEQMDRLMNPGKYK